MHAGLVFFSFPCSTYARCVCGTLFRVALGRRPLVLRPLLRAAVDAATLFCLSFSQTIRLVESYFLAHGLCADCLRHFALVLRFHELYTASNRQSSLPKLPLAAPWRESWGGADYSLISLLDVKKIKGSASSAFAVKGHAWNQVCSATLGKSVRGCGCVGQPGRSLASTVTSSGTCAACIIALPPPSIQRRRAPTRPPASQSRPAPWPAGRHRPRRPICACGCACCRPCAARTAA